MRIHYGCTGLVFTLFAVLGPACMAQYSTGRNYSYPGYAGPQSGYQSGYRSQHQSYSGTVRPAYSNYGNRYNSRSVVPQYRSYQSVGGRTQGYDAPVLAMRSAMPGRYYHWDQAEGTSARGYIAKDGSRWRLLKAAGIVEVDTNGRRHIVSSSASGHPYQYVWQIDRGTSSKTAWISRHEDTGIVSVLYKRPAYQASQNFYQAKVTLNDESRIVGVQWVQTPSWASSVNVASGSRGPRLPDSIYRSTSQQYVPASLRDVEIVRQGFSGGTSNPEPQLLRPYEDSGIANTPQSDAKVLGFSILGQPQPIGN